MISNPPRRVQGTVTSCNTCIFEVNTQSCCYGNLTSPRADPRASLQLRRDINARPTLLYSTPMSGTSSHSSSSAPDIPTRFARRSSTICLHRSTSMKPDGIMRMP